MVDFTDRRLGPFEIRSLIGTGAFASVYRAHDPRLETDVAIKILAENHSLNLETRERFIGEAMALRRVNSDSVTTIYDIQETPDGRPYLVLELADRGTSAERRRALTGDGWRPRAIDVKCVVEALANALTAVHTSNMVHRDVAPSNLLIRSGEPASRLSSASFLYPDERLLLSDMGLAKDLSAASGITSGAGTLGYAAPEQRQPLGIVDERTDVFGASAVIVWLLTGDPPIPDLGWAETIERDWHPKVLETLESGLAEDPDERPSSIGDWKHQLVGALNFEPAVVSKSSLRATFGASHPADRRKLVRIAAVALIAALGIALGIRALISGPDDEPLIAQQPLVAGTTQTTTVGSEGTATTQPSRSTSEAEPAAPTQAGPGQPQVSRVLRGSDAVLTIAWGGEEDVGAATGSEIEVSIEGGPWVSEVSTADTSAGGWELWSLADPEDANADRTKPSWDLTYAVRVRWLYEDDVVSLWSPTQTLEPGPAPVRSDVVTDVAAPSNQALFFVEDGDEVRLAVGWGAGDPGLAEAVATEVSVSVDGEEWFTEEAFDAVLAAAWEIWSLGPQNDRLQVTDQHDYRTRIRWLLADGSVTDWSSELVLDAGTPAQPRGG